MFTYGSSMATPAYAQLTHGLRVPYAKKHYHFNEGRTEKKNMPFILLLSIIEIEIAFIHISLTQLTRKHTPQFCLRILTRLKVLLTQPFDMSNPFRKQSTGVLNAALCCSCCSFQKGLQVSSGRGRGAVTETLREASTALGSCLLLNGTFSVKILEGPKDLKIFLAKNLEHPYT